MKSHIQNLFFLVRFGDLAEIKKGNYSLGEQVFFNSAQQNDFLDVYDKNDKNPLARAIQYKRNDIIDFMYSSVSEKIFKTNKKDFRGRTQLYFAAACGNLSEVLRLKSNDNIDEPDIEGKTPLYVAAEQGHLEVVRALVEAGARIDAGAKPGPLEIPPGVDVDEHGGGKTALWIAAARGHHEVVEMLVSEGANINHPGAMKTPIYVAALNGQTKVVAKLLALGANYSRAYDGKTSLFVAASNGHLEAAALLLDAGAPVDQAYKGQTPLCAAADQGHFEVVKLLLNAKA